MNKYKDLERLDEERSRVLNDIENQLNECQIVLDDTIKHQSIVFDKLQYIKNNQNININFNYRLDSYLNGYLEEVKTIVNKKIYALEDEREEYLKQYQSKYDAIMEGNYETKYT